MSYPFHMPVCIISDVMSCVSPIVIQSFIFKLHGTAQVVLSSAYALQLFAEMMLRIC